MTSQDDFGTLAIPLAIRTRNPVSSSASPTPSKPVTPQKTTADTYQSEASPTSSSPVYPPCSPDSPSRSALYTNDEIREMIYAQRVREAEAAQAAQAAQMAVEAAQASQTPVVERQTETEMESPVSRPTSPAFFARSPIELSPVSSIATPEFSFAPQSPRETPGSPEYIPGSPFAWPDSPVRSPLSLMESPLSPVESPSSPVSPVDEPSSPVRG